MLTIRLRRHGARKDPHYRVVVTERSAKRDGPFIEILGHYHPRKRPAEIVFDMERTESWLGKGAEMSDTVRTLYNKVRSGAVEMPEPEAQAPAANPAETASPTPEEASSADAESVEETEEAPASDEAAGEEE